MRRSIVLAAGILVLLFAACVAGWLAIRFWPISLAWGYFGIAFLIVLFSSYGYFLIYRRKKMTDPLFLENTIIAVHTGDTLFARVRFWMSISITQVSESLAWPSSLLAASRTFQNVRKNFAKAGGFAFNVTMGLNAPVALDAAARSLIVIAASATGYFFPSALGYCVFLLAMFAISVMMRHLSLLLSLSSLAKNLRSNPGSPYLRFLAVAGADLLSLLLGFAFLSSWRHGSPIGLEELRVTAVDMFTFAKMRAAFMEGTFPTWWDALVSLAGGLYLVSGFKSALKHQDFNRTADDFHTLAAKLLLIGEHKKSRWWLGKVKEPDATTYSLQAMSYLAAGDFQKARRSAESAVEENGVPAHLKELEMCKILLTPTPTMPWEKGTLIEFFRFLITTSRQDFIQPGIVEQWIQRGLATGEELLEVMDSDESRKRHPLTYGLLQYKIGNFHAAIEALGEYESADSGRILCFYLAYRCIWTSHLLAGSEDMSVLQEFWKEGSPQLPELLRKVDSDFERLNVIEWLGLVVDIAALHALEHASEAAELENSLRQEVSGSEDAQRGIVTADRIRETRRQEMAALLERLRKEPSANPVAAGSSA